MYEFYGETGSCVAAAFFVVVFFYAAGYVCGRARVERTVPTFQDIDMPHSVTGDSVA